MLLFSHHFSRLSPVARWGLSFSRHQTANLPRERERERERGRERAPSSSSSFSFCDGAFSLPPSIHDDPSILCEGGRVFGRLQTAMRKSKTRKRIRRFPQRETANAMQCRCPPPPPSPPPCVFNASLAYAYANVLLHPKVEL